MKYLKLFENFQEKKFDQLLLKLETYNLNKNDFAIFGSAPLVAKGLLEDVNDLDIIVRPSAWDFDSVGEFRDLDLEFFDNWSPFDIDDLIDNQTFEYNGFKFVNIDYVYQYKQSMGRDKDKNVWNK
jgi:hypothetical protein